MYTIQGVSSGENVMTERGESPLFQILCCGWSRRNDTTFGDSAREAPYPAIKMASISTIASLRSAATAGGNLEKSKKGSITRALPSSQLLFGTFRCKEEVPSLSGGARRFSAFRHRTKPNIRGRRGRLDSNDYEEHDPLEATKILPPSRRQSLIQWITEQLRQGAPKRSTAITPDVAAALPLASPVTRRAARRQLSGFRRRSYSANADNAKDRSPKLPLQESTADPERRSSFKRIFSVVLRQRHSKICFCRSRRGVKEKANAMDPDPDELTTAEETPGRRTYKKIPSETRSCDEGKPKQHQPLSRTTGQLVTVVDIHSDDKWV